MAIKIMYVKIESPKATIGPNQEPAITHKATT